MISPVPEEEPLSRYHDQKQPPINQRLQQIYNLLADEDIYRCFNFAGRLHEIRAYIQDLQTGAQKDEEYNRELLASIKAQITIHEQWNKEATKTTEFEFTSPLLERNPRLMPRTWEPKRPLIDLELENLGKYGQPNSLTETKLHVTLQEETGKRPDDEPDPFEYTKLVAKYRQQQETKAKHIRKKHEYDATLGFNPLPANFKGPWLPPSTDSLVEEWRVTHQKLNKLFDDLVEAHSDAPRSPLTEVVNIINKDVRSSETPPISEPVKAAGLTRDDLDKLSILARKSTVQTHTSQLNGPPANFCNRVESLMDDHAFWPRGVDTPMKIDDLFERVEKMGKLGLQHGQMIRLLQIMVEDRRIRFEGSVVRRPLPTSHPEDDLLDVMSTSDWVTIAERAVLYFLRLSYHLEHHKDEGHMERVIGECARDLRQRVRRWEVDVDNNTRGPHLSLLDMARRVADAQQLRGELDDAMAATLLQGQIAEESNNNWEVRATPETIWGWARGRNNNIGQRFRVNKWSPTVQLADYHRKHAQWAVRRQRRLQQLHRTTSRNVRDVGNKVVSKSSKDSHHVQAGSSFFPLGETLPQEYAMSRRITHFLRNEKVKAFDYIIKDFEKDEDAPMTTPIKTASSETGPTTTTPKTTPEMPEKSMEKEDDEGDNAEEEEEEL